MIFRDPLGYTQRETETERDEIWEYSIDEFHTAKGVCVCFKPPLGFRLFLEKKETFIYCMTEQRNQHRF